MFVAWHAFVVYREIWVLIKLLGTLNQSILFVIIRVEFEFLEHGLMIVSFRGFAYVMS